MVSVVMLSVMLSVVILSVVMVSVVILSVVMVSVVILSIVTFSVVKQSFVLLTGHVIRVYALISVMIFSKALNTNLKTHQLTLRTKLKQDIMVDIHQTTCKRLTIIFWLGMPYITLAKSF
jgi:hypothetical protein